MDALPSYGRGGYERHKVKILPINLAHLPVNVQVHAQLLQLQLGIACPAMEFLDGALRLDLQGVTYGGVLAGLSIVTPVDLVQRHNKGCAAVAQHSLQALNCLLFQSMHEIYHEYGHIAEQAAP